MLELLEQKTVGRLAFLKDKGIQVIPYPDDPDEFNKPMGNRRVFVGIKRETLESLGNSGLILESSIVQSRRVEVEIYCQLKELRSHAGIYPMIELIRNILTGFRPFQEDPENYQSYYWNTRTEFIRQFEGYWDYAMNFEILIPYVKEIWQEID